MDRQARPCFFLNFGYNHGSDCFKVMDAETGRIVHSRDVTWHQPREPLISRARQLDRACPSRHLMPRYRTTSTSRRPPPRLLPRRCLRLITLHPRRHDNRPRHSPIALFGSWDMRATSVCLVARGARRERCGNLRAAWVLCLTPLWHRG